MKKLISLIVVFFLSVFGVAATAEPSLAPEKLVMDVSTQVLDEIKKDPALAAADPAHVNQLVDKRSSAQRDHATVPHASRCCLLRRLEGSQQLHGRAGKISSEQ